MKLQPHLDKAVKAEISWLKQEKEKQQKLSPVELRSQGLSVFPLDCKKANYSGNNCDLVLAASFHINDTYFYRGCKIILHLEDQRIEGRLRDLSAYEMEISVAVDDDFNPYEGKLRVDFEPDDRTLQCMELGIRFLGEKKHLHEFETALSRELPDFNPFSTIKLNSDQQIAAGAILSDHPALCIQGPPGTGKTTVLSTAISELVKQGKQVIICAPSNTAVDNLCLRLLENSIELLRLGNDEKIHSSLLPFTIEGHLERKQGKLVAHLEKSIQNQLQVVNRFSRNFNADAREEKKIARNELKSLRTELRQLQKQFLDQLITTIPVIAGTPVSLFNQLPKEKLVDAVIMDEAGQSLSPLTWLAASFGKRLILCGDPQQLPPVVFSNEAVSLGLNEQYRFGEEIVGAINAFFYNKELRSNQSNGESRFLFIDTAGFGEGEQKDEISGSTFNLSEVEAIEKVIEHFSLAKKNTVILSPYNAQIDEISRKTGPDWKVSTIDSMQGQEADNCIISLTRSNENGDLGFLKDSSTLGSDKFYAELIQYAENTGGYRSIYEYIC
jgi:superfamily I DNA and/or RNA helicase